MDSRRLSAKVELSEAEEGKPVRLSMTASNGTPMLRGRDFRSGKPIYEEIDVSNMDVSLLASGTAPFLLEHRPNLENQIGVVETARKAEGQLFAEVRMFDDEQSKAIESKMRQGANSVSIGYDVLDSEVVEHEDRFVLKSKASRPFEISAVSTPANESVGIFKIAAGRLVELDPSEAATQANMGDDPMADNETAEAEDAEQEDKAPVRQTAAKVESNALDKDAVRKAALEDAQLTVEWAKDWEGTLPGITAKAQEMVYKGASYDDVKQEVLKRNAAKNEEAKDERAVARKLSIGANEKELKRFSFTALIEHAADPNNPQWAEAAKPSIEMSMEAARQEGSQPDGVGKGAGTRGRYRIPVDVMLEPVHANDKVAMHLANTRRTAASVDSQSTPGSNLVEQEFRADSFISLVRAANVWQQMGIMRISAMGNVRIPVHKAAGGNAAAVGTAEMAEITEDNADWDAIDIVPKQYMALEQYTPAMNVQSALSYEGLTREDLALSMGTRIDKDYANGRVDPTSGAIGSSQTEQRKMLGLPGVTDVQLVTDGHAAAVDFDNALMTKMELMLEQENFNAAEAVYVIPPAVKAQLRRTRPLGSTSTDSMTMWDHRATDGRNIFGSDAMVMVSNNLLVKLNPGATTGQVFLVVPRALGFCDWIGGYDLLVDNLTGRYTNEIKVSILGLFNSFVRYPKALVIADRGIKLS